MLDLKDVEFLYQLLLERQANASISHKKMPTPEEHLLFVLKEPYKKWFIVFEKGERVASFYLTRKNEIGIAVIEKYRGRGIGKEIISHILKTENGRLLANINPKNKKSIALFEKF